MAEPVLVGLLFADRVITEKNGKKGIIGTFTRFHSTKFPVSFPPWSIYAAVTNLQGEFDFTLNLVSEKEQVIVPIHGKFKVEDPSGVVELAFDIGGAIFPAPGNYTLTFHVDGLPVGSRVLQVSELKQ